MSNPTFKPSEGKREEFRKYLEKNGVMDALTKVLVNLYEELEKPEDALEYIRDRLAIQAGLETYSQMKSKLDESQLKIDSLTAEVEELKQKAEAAAAEMEAGAAEAPPEGETEPAEENPPEEGAEAPPVEETPQEEQPAPAE